MALSDKLSHVYKWTVAECNEQVGRWLTPVLPNQADFPETKITLLVKEDSTFIKSSVVYGVQIEQPIHEFAKTIMGVKVFEKREKENTILTIGNEVIPGGLYILYSVLEQQMLCMNFYTEAEAKAYKNHFVYLDSKYQLGQFVPHKVQTSFPQHPWFNGDFINPAELSFLTISSNKVAKDSMS